MNRRTACSILAFALLCGCATTVPIQPIGRGEPVQIVVTMSPQADGIIKIRNEAIGNDVSVGAGSGMVVGGLWGLVCGPFAVLCVPLGMATGAFTGTAAGAVVGLTGALPEDKATALRERLVRVQQSHALLAELRAHVTDRAQRFWNLGADRPATVVTVELQDLLLTSTRDERIRCVVQVRVGVQPSGAKRETTPWQKQYEYVGSFTSLAVWLDEGSDFVDTSLTSASQQLAAQIVSDLSTQ